MKKKIMSFILAICLMVPCVFALSACGNETQQEQTLTKAEYAKVYGSVTDAYDNYMEQQEANEAGLMATIQDSDFVDVNNVAQAKNMVVACVQVVGFLKNLCENETFTLTDGATDMVLVDDHDPNRVENFDVRVQMSYDAKASKVTAIFYAEEQLESNIYKSYFVFDIAYNFKTETLGSFGILGYSGMGENVSTDGVRYFVFENNSLKMLSMESDVFEEFANGVLEEFQQYTAPAWQENAPDYSEEYLNAMYGEK